MILLYPFFSLGCLAEALCFQLWNISEARKKQSLMKLQLPNSCGGRSDEGIASTVQLILPSTTLVTFCKDLTVAENLVNTSPCAVHSFHLGLCPDMRHRCHKILIQCRSACWVLLTDTNTESAELQATESIRGDLLTSYSVSMESSLVTRS